ncbi:hypothetical protein C8J56DRAFT_960359 [Mycena floridula]|nr:hypothetical protein C8J56DRAFT_960359 [Mycena floridula]
MFPFILLILASQSLAFRLQIPTSTVISGVVVSVRWTLENGDPFSFGIMQRSLQDDQVKAVTPVENNNLDTTGTVDIVFNSVGQVLLAGIAQLQ